MKKYVLITGINGAGKSSLSHKLREMGHESHDADSVPKLFSMVDKVTRVPISEYSNDDPRKVKNMLWICSPEKLNALLASSNGDLVFFCGIASNLDEIYPLFDIAVLLTAPHEVIRERLATRTSNDFAKHPDIQEHILGYKRWLENHLLKKGAHLVDATKDLDNVASEVVHLCSRT